MGYAKKCSDKSLTILGNNTAGLKSKKESLVNLMKQLNAGVTMLQETKLYKKGSMKFKNMFIFEKIRGAIEGGGLMTLIHENFKPVLIPCTVEYFFTWSWMQTQR